MTQEEFLNICSPGVTSIDTLGKALIDSAPAYIPDSERGIAAAGASAMAFHLLVELIKIGVIEVE